ncbi:TetR family transcriptional regulator C-terminal domain-containing protein [Psychromonas sp. 14N.309.X.WAT.B.A12]|uniref:TetR family transcriptional regulator C-terminal domain-containing protein n=1 Tax=Psychromonas sp. 14N.309.X.WAT.B.A12 TaxID=2998322 RepID=UPI0025B12DE3|nr:TetR family transcriptional regulator C-terminal domain-containing protein [Psychromonas sp. 14N.309.X.WAT.B.A12]MDN2662323.1 TetR family transcriptional regulator C-terminal domain-containing protein [Psychromonas sp. 14N.309.X.WAT.B.A12]
MRVKKFDRIEPDERKSLMVQGVIRSLIADGYAGLSVRKITKEANVSQGLVNHHFGSMNALIIYAYQSVSDEFMVNIESMLEACEGDASAQLDAFFRIHFDVESFDQSLLKPWLVFWSLIRDSEGMADAYETANGRIEVILKALLNEIKQDENLQGTNVSLATQGLMALLDGLWVRQCLAPQHISLQDSLSVCRNWTIGFKAGLYN